MSEERKNEGKFWLGFFIGGLIGAIVIVFMGTKEGKKTGKLLEEKGKDALDLLQEKLAELEQKGKELEEQVIEKLEDTKEVLAEKTSEKLDETLSHIEAIQERGRETTANLRHRLFKNLPKKTG